MTFSRIMVLSAVLSAFVLTSEAQTDIAPMQPGPSVLVDAGALPKNFAAFGAGLHGGAALTGVTAFCHQASATNYVCAESLLSGSTTANKVLFKQVVAAKHGAVLAIDAGAGVATGADGGTGGAFGVGGSVLYNVSRFAVLRSRPGLWAGFSAQWDKRDVYDFRDSLGTVRGARDALRPFVAKGNFTFFVGRAW